MSEFVRPTQNEIEILSKLGLKSPDVAMIRLFSQRVKSLMGPLRERIFEGLYHPLKYDSIFDRLITAGGGKDVLEKLAFASLPIEGRGVEAKPTYEFYTILPQGVFQEPICVCGQVYKKEGKPYPADVVGFLNWTAEVPSIGPIDFTLAYCADGASSLATTSDSQFSEIARVCTMNDKNGNPQFCPDTFWATGLKAILTPDEKQFRVSTPEAFRVHPIVREIRRRKLWEKIQQDITHSFIEGKFKIPASKIAAECIEKNIDPMLSDYIHSSFSLYGDDTFELYPSGVIGLALFIRPLSEKAIEDSKRLRLPSYHMYREYLEGFASTGDISIAESRLGALPIQFDVSNDSSVVDRHDRVRKKDDQFTSLEEKERYLREIAQYRWAFTGNLPFPPRLVNELMGTIQSNHFLNDVLIVDGSHPVMFYSDGLKEKYTEGDLILRRLKDHANNYRDDSLNSITYQDGFVRGFDWTTSYLCFDPALYILSQRHQYLKYMENTGKPLRGDDGSWVYIGPVSGIDRNKFHIF